MNFNEKIQFVRKHVKSGSELMGSRWKNCEAETIALQTICACGLNLEKDGEAISWQGAGTLRFNNSDGVKRLLNDGMIVLESYDNPLGLKIPKGTVCAEDGKPMVFKCTEKLLDYVIAFMKLTNY